MRTKNETVYATRELRRVACAVHNHVAKAEGRLPWWDRTTLEFRRTKPHTYNAHGEAWRRYARIWLPYRPAQEVVGRGTAPERRCTYAQIVGILWHEILHLYGYSQKQMHHGGMAGPATASRDAIYEKLGVARDDTLPMRAPPTPKPQPTTADKQAAKYERLLVREKLWLTKQKRANTALREIARQKRYYERTLKAAGRLSEGGDE